MNTNTIFFRVFPCMTLLVKQSPSCEIGSLNSNNIQENVNVKVSNKSTELKFSTQQSALEKGGGGEKKKQNRNYETKLTASLLKQNQNTQKVEKKAVLTTECKICANFSAKTPFSNNRQTHNTLTTTDEKCRLILHLMLECVQQTTTQSANSATE